MFNSQGRPWHRYREARQRLDKRPEQVRLAVRIRRSNARWPTGSSDQPICHAVPSGETALFAGMPTATTNESRPLFRGQLCRRPTDPGGGTGFAGRSFDRLGADARMTGTCGLLLCTMIRQERLAAIPRSRAMRLCDGTWHGDWRAMHRRRRSSRRQYSRSIRSDEPRSGLRPR